MKIVKFLYLYRDTLAFVLLFGIFLFIGYYFFCQNVEIIYVDWPGIHFSIQEIILAGSQEANHMNEDQSVQITNPGNADMPSIGKTAFVTTTTVTIGVGVVVTGVVIYYIINFYY